MYNSIASKALYSVIIFISFAVIIFTGYKADAEEVATITATKETVTAVNAPQNSTLIVALYENERMLEAKTYHSNGNGAITADFVTDMQESLLRADTIKAFLWNMQTMSPLCENFRSEIKDLPNVPNNEIQITANGEVFMATLTENTTSDAFKRLLPATFPMIELNGNEKYYYLNDSLPTAPERVGTIRAGDIMLYGSSCIVIFYETFTTSYSYTRIGHINDVAGLKTALGRGSVSIQFEQ